MDAFSHADEVDACVNKKDKILNDSRRNRLNHLLDCALLDDLNYLLNFSQKQFGILQEEMFPVDPETFDRTGA